MIFGGASGAGGGSMALKRVHIRGSVGWRSEGREGKEREQCNFSPFRFENKLRYDFKLPLHAHRKSSCEVP